MDKSIKDIAEYLDFKKVQNILLLGWAILCTYLLYLSWDWDYTMDVPPIRYAAKRILQGEILYKDIIEFNLPFTYLIHLIILSVSESDLAVRIADLLFTAIGITGVFFLTKHKKMTLLFGFLFFHLNVCLLSSTLLLQREMMLTCLLPYILYPFWHSPTAKIGQVIGSAIVLFCAMLIKPIILVLGIGLWVLFYFDQRINLSIKRNIVVAYGTTLLAATITFILLLHLYGLLPYFWNNLWLLQYFSTIKTEHHTWLKFLKLFVKWGGLLFLIGSIFHWKYINTEKGRYLAALLIYTIFHFFLQKKGYTYHLHLFLAVLLAVNAFYITYQSRNVWFNQFVLFSFFLCFLYAVRIGIKVQPLQSNVKKAIHLLQDYPFKTIQTVDCGAAGIEIVERLNLKNKYPIFYNFVYDAPNPTIQAYKKNLVQDIQAGNIDVVIYGEIGILDKTTEIGKELAPFMIQNYDTLISLPPYKSMVYVAKKLQKKK